MSNAPLSIKCEHCGANLKLPPTILPGKKIKCPKCSGALIVPTTSAGSPPPKDGKKDAVVKPAKPIDDDEDDNQRYGIKESANPEADKKAKPKINYGPDTSVKDIRGPVQAALLGPSNKIMARSMFCCALCIFSFGAGVWDFVFSEDILDYRDTLKAYFKNEQDNKALSAEEKKRIAKRGSDIAKDNKNEILARNVYPEVVEREKKLGLKDLDPGITLELPEQKFIKEIRVKQIPYRIAWIIFSLLILIYNAVQAMASVKMQSLESYKWSIACAVMGIIPFNCIGLFTKIWSADVQPDPMLFVPDEGFDLLQLFTHPLFLLCLEYVGSLGMGIMALQVLLREEVKAGFKYKGEI